MLDSMFWSTCFLSISQGLANIFWNWLVIGLTDLNLCTLDLYEKKALINEAYDQSVSKREIQNLC